MTERQEYHTAPNTNVHRRDGCDRALASHLGRLVLADLIEEWDHRRGMGCVASARSHLTHSGSVVQKAVRVGPRLLKPEMVQRLQGALQGGALSRAALGRGLCELHGRRNAGKKLCSASVRKA